MKTFRKHLSKKISNEIFQKQYEEEKKLIDLSLKIHDE
jgi:HTH-type transcriptional regulator/antitoxin HipB